MTAPALRDSDRLTGNAAPPTRETTTPPSPTANAALRVLAACAVVLMLQVAAPVLLPIVVSILLFYALDPIVGFVARGRIPRVVASSVVVCGLVAGTAAGAALLWPEVDAVVTRIPAGADELRAMFRRQRAVQQQSVLGRVQAAATALDSAAAEAGAAAPRNPGVLRVEVQQPKRVSDWLWAGGVGMLGVAAQSITVLFLTVFLLNGNDSFKRKLVRQMNTLGSKRVTVRILNDIATQVERFIWVQVFTSTAVAVATGLVLWWFGLQEAAVWGVFAGVMNIVPYFGPLVVTVVVAMVAFLQFGTLEMAGLLAGATLAITTFEGMLLTPHLLSRAASINHVAIFVAIAFWSWTWGVPGLLLAVPMLMVIKAVADHVDGWHAISDFLGE